MEFPAFVSKSYTLFSRKGACARTVNLGLEKMEAETGRNAYMFLKSPGLKGLLRPSGGNGTARGSIELNEHLFIVFDSMIYDILSDMTINRTYGPIADDGKPVVMSIDNLSCLIVSSGILYAINSGTLAVPPTPVKPISVALRGLWVIIGPAAPDQLFFFSVDGLSWDPLDFQSTEEAPNNIIALIADHLQLWFIGNRISQPFQLGSDPNTPFVPIQNGVVQEGTAAAASVAALDNSLLFVGKNKNGERTVVRMNGYNPERISKHNIETAMSGYPRVDDAIGMPYQLAGHSRYRLTFPAADATWEYDTTVDDWTEVAAWDVPLGQFHRHRANTIVSAFGKILIGDKLNGWIAEMSPAYYSDDVGGLMGNGGIIRWLRRAPHIVKENKEICYHRVEIDGEKGVGDGSNGDPLNGVVTPEYEPLMMIRWDVDTQNPSNEYLRSMGKQGETEKMIAINSPGTARDRVWEVSGTASVKIAIFSMYFDAETLA